jgi:hypothetical protein
LLRSSNRGAFQLKHGANQPANRWYERRQGSGGVGTPLSPLRLPTAQ